MLTLASVSHPASSQPAAQSENDTWFADSESGCKFSVKWLKPGGGEGGIWRLESTQTAKWSGACVDGMASGVGTAIVSIRPVMPTGEPKTGKPLLNQLFAHWPPFENLFYGNFDGGRPNGSVVIRYSNGLSAIESFDHGVVRGEPVVQFDGERNDWVTLPLDQVERLIRRDFSSGRVRARPIDPRQGTDAGWGMVRGSPRVARILDISGYADLASFRGALDKEFPLFAPAKELRDHLIWLSDENLRSAYFDAEINAGCRYTLSLLLQAQSAWHCVYSMQKGAGTKYREKWVYAVVFSDDATLMYYELHRYLNPDDFVSRGIPLKVENFIFGKDFMSAAMQLLGPTPTMERVAEVMESAGMKLSNRQSHEAVMQVKPVPPRPPLIPGSPAVNEAPQPPTPPQPIRVGYYDERANNGEHADKGEGGIFSVLLTGCGHIIALDFEFDPVTRTLVKVTPYDDAGCL